MKKDRKEFEKWAIPLLKKAQKILLIEHYEPLDIEHREDVNYAECACHQPYQSITIRYSDKVVEDWKKEKSSVIGVLVHEMMHVVTDPFYHVAVQRYTNGREMEDARERMTDHLTNIILKNGLM